MQLVGKSINTVSNIIGTVTGTTMGYFESTFPYNYFNHIYVNTKLTQIERYQSKKKLVKPRTPAIAYSPSLSFDTEYKTHEYLKPEATIFMDENESIIIDTIWERIKITTDVKLMLESPRKAQDAQVLMQTHCQTSGPFHLGMTDSKMIYIEVPVPNKILKQLMILKGWYYNNSADIDQLLEYLNLYRPRDSYYKRKINQSTGKLNIFFIFPVSIMAELEDIEYDSEKHNNSRGNGFVSTSIVSELFIPIDFSLKVANDASLLTTYRRLMTFINVMNMPDHTKLNVLKLKNVIEDLFFEGGGGADALHYDLQELLEKPEFNSLKKRFDSFMESDDKEEFLSSLKGALDTSGFNDFIHNTKKIMGTHFDNFGIDYQMDTDGDIIYLDVSRDLNGLTTEEIAMVKFFDREYNEAKIDQTQYDFSKDYNKKYETEYERSVYFKDLENKVTNPVHPGFVTYVEFPADLEERSRKFSVMRNDVFSINNRSEKDVNYDDELIGTIRSAINNMETLRGSRLKALYSNVEDVKEFEGMITLNYNVLNGVESRRDGRKIFYHNEFITDINARIDTVNLIEEFTENEKEVITYFISVGGDVNDMFTTYLYNRTSPVKGDGYNMNWFNYILTVSNPIYNMNYYVSMYVDEILFRKMKKMLYESKKR